MKIALTIPGMSGTPIDSGLPVPVGGLFNYKDPNNPIIGGTGTSIIETLIIFFVIVAIFFALWAIFKGGLELIQANGRKESIQKAWYRILYGVLGLVMVFGAFLYIGAFSHFLGANLLPFLPFMKFR